MYSRRAVRKKLKILAHTSLPIYVYIQLHFSSNRSVQLSSSQSKILLLYVPTIRTPPWYISTFIYTQVFIALYNVRINRDIFYIATKQNSAKETRRPPPRVSRHYAERRRRCMAMCVCTRMCRLGNKRENFFNIRFHLLITLQYRCYHASKNIYGCSQTYTQHTTTISAKSVRAHFYEKQNQEDLRVAIIHIRELQVLLYIMYTYMYIDKIVILLYLNNGGASSCYRNIGLKKKRIQNSMQVEQLLISHYNFSIQKTVTAIQY